MVWGRKVMAGALALTATMVALPAAAETIVIRASGPSAKSYPPGRKLADSGSVALKAGDVVTLLDARGTRTLRGPGNFGVVAAASMGGASATTLAALLDTKRVRRARTGAVRGVIGDTVPGPVRRPNLWLVDLAQPGTVCVADPATVRLWRPNASAAATVTASGGGASVPVAFGAGEAMAAWPAALPVKEGASYRLSWAGQAKPVDIRFALLADAGTDLSSTASGLIAHDCTAQLDQLATTSALPDSAPGS